MTVKYLDPYKDDKYGKLKGDKAEAYFGVTFSEAVVHKTDDAYIIAGYATDYKSIVRGFKPELALDAGLCAIPIYGKEYEIRKKDKDGNWSSDKITPSLFEKGLYDTISLFEDEWMPHNAAISVSLTHIPNGMMGAEGEKGIAKLVENNIKINQVNLSGKLPEYTPPSNNGQRKGGGKSWGISPDEKLTFLQKQIAKDIKTDGFKEGRTFAEVTEQFMLEHANDENFISIYFDMLTACVR